jgi:hypothetical protein
MPLAKSRFARNAMASNSWEDSSEELWLDWAPAVSQMMIDLIRRLCHSQDVMRLLVQILIIAGLIYLGWNKPFKEQVAQANRTISTKLHNLGSALQKHQDPSVRRP